MGGKKGQRQTAFSINFIFFIPWTPFYFISFLTNPISLSSSFLIPLHSHQFHFSLSFSLSVQYFSLKILPAYLQISLQLWASSTASYITFLFLSLSPLSIFTFISFYPPQSCISFLFTLHFPNTVSFQSITYFSRNSLRTLFRVGRGEGGFTFF